MYGVLSVIMRPKPTSDCIFAVYCLEGLDRGWSLLSFGFKGVRFLRLTNLGTMDESNQKQIQLGSQDDREGVGRLSTSQVVRCGFRFTFLGATDTEGSITKERLVKVSAGKVNPRQTREVVEALTEAAVIEMNCIGRGMSSSLLVPSSLGPCCLREARSVHKCLPWLRLCYVHVARRCPVRTSVLCSSGSCFLFTNVDEWVICFASEVGEGMRAGEVALEGGAVEACVSVEQWLGMEALVQAEADGGSEGGGDEVRYKGRVWPCTPLMFDMEEVKARFLEETGVSGDQLLVWKRNVVDGVAESSWWFETGSWPDGVKFHSWDMMSYRRTRVRVTAVCITLGTRKRKRGGRARVRNRLEGEEAAAWLAERKKAKGAQAAGKGSAGNAGTEGVDYGLDIGGGD